MSEDKPEPMVLEQNEVAPEAPPETKIQDDTKGGLSVHKIPETPTPTIVVDVEAAPMKQEVPVPSVQPTIETPTTVETTTSEAPAALNPPKKRGRPPLNPDEKKDKPKKRGRPPKSTTPGVEGSSESEGAEADGTASAAEGVEGAAPVKRGRGRPRKGEIVPPKPDSKAPKKRGRPPKNADDDGSAKKKPKLDDGKAKKRKEEKAKQKDKKNKAKKDKALKRMEKKKKDTDARFPYRINISVGADHSTGPGFYSVTIVKSTLSSEDLEKAYKLGTAKLGFDFQKEICTNNQNCALSSEHFKKLAACGVPVSDDGGGEEDLDFELTLESYRDIWLHISRLGNPNLNWVVAELDALPIGGNGLFQDLVDQRRGEEPQQPAQQIEPTKTKEIETPIIDISKPEPQEEPMVIETTTTSTPVVVPPPTLVVPPPTLVVPPPTPVVVPPPTTTTEPTAIQSTITEPTPTVIQTTTSQPETSTVSSGPEPMVTEVSTN